MLFPILLGLALITLSSASQFGIAGPGQRNIGLLRQYRPDGMILFGGLNSAQVSFNDTHLYNMTTGQWKMIRTFGIGPSPRVHATGDIYQNKLYVYGGARNWNSVQYGPPLGDYFSLDLTTFTWSQLPGPGVSQIGSVSTILDDSLILFGGSSALIPLDFINIPTYVPLPCSAETYLFNFTTHKWTNLTLHTGLTPISACYSSIITISPTRALLTGGSLTEISSAGIWLPSSTYAQIWQFDITTRKWSNITNPHGPYPLSRGNAIWLYNPITQLAYYGFGSNMVSGNLVPFSQIDVYNVTSNTWQVAFQTTNYYWFQFSGSGLYHGNFFIYGFFDNGINGASSDMIYLNPNPFTITNIAQINDYVTSSGIHRVFYGSVIDSYVWWMFGGALDGNDASCSNTLTRCDLTINTCTLVPTTGTIPIPRFSPVMATYAPGKLLLFGGVSNNWASN